MPLVKRRPNYYPEGTIYNEEVKAFVAENVNKYFNAELCKMLDEKFPELKGRFKPRALAMRICKWGLKRDKKAAAKLRAEVSKGYWKAGIMQNCVDSTKRDTGYVRYCNYKGKKPHLRVKTEKGWRLLHVVVWETHHGPVPRNQIIKFKDGNRLNCDIKNLELKSRQEDSINLSDNYVIGKLIEGTPKEIRDSLKKELLENYASVIDVYKTAKQNLRETKAKGNTSLAGGNKKDEGPLL